MSLVPGLKKGGNMSIPGRIEDVFEGYYKTLVDRRLAMFSEKDIIKFGIISLTEQMTERIATEYQAQGWIVDFEIARGFSWFTFVREGAELPTDEEPIE